MRVKVTPGFRKGRDVGHTAQGLTFQRPVHGQPPVDLPGTAGLLVLHQPALLDKDQHALVHLSQIDAALLRHRWTLCASGFT
jgi:hypothetical protein